MANLTEHHEEFYGSSDGIISVSVSDAVLCSYNHADGTVQVIECEDSTMACCGQQSYRYCCRRWDIATSELIIGVAFAGVFVFFLLSVCLVYTLLSIPVWAEKFKVRRGRTGQSSELPRSEPSGMSAAATNNQETRQEREKLLQSRNISGTIP